MASTALSRRQFLRGDFSSRTAVMRPPWSLVDALFVDACTRCDDCIEACPEKILKRDRQGYPMVDFSSSECTFCGDCAAICKAGAFGSVKAQPWNWVATIHNNCLAYKQVECRSCGEQCEYEAIRFPLAASHAATPQLDQSLCNGCGACVGICPARAIHMIHAAVQPVRGEVG